jgi:hypothetical protein
MQAGKILLISLAVLVVIYAGFILTLYLLGRKQDARAWAGFIPDCITLFKRLMGTPPCQEAASYGSAL